MSTKRFSLLAMLMAGVAFTVSSQTTEPPDDHPGAEDAHKIGAFHLVKLFPSFSGFDFVGGGIAYETGAGIYPFSVNASVRYYNGSLPLGLQDTIDRHIRFELQGRFWPIQTFRALFTGVLVNAYSTGGIGVGGLIGYHVFISKQVVAEASIGINSRTKTLQTESPILLRYGLSIGLIFPKMLRYGY